MKLELAHIALVVEDYDAAIAFYIENLHFRLIEDTMLYETKRWVILAPPGSSGCQLLLAKAANNAQQTRIGNHTGGRVFLFPHTDNFNRDYHSMLANGIVFVREPVAEPYVTVAILKTFMVISGI